MVVDAMIYMYFVGFGTSLGVATVAWIAWKIVQRQRSNKGKRKGVLK